MLIRYLSEVNTPHIFIPKGTETDVPNDEAVLLIEGGIAEAVEAKAERAVKPAARKAVKK